MISTRLISLVRSHGLELLAARGFASLWWNKGSFTIANRLGDRLQHSSAGNSGSSCEEAVSKTIIRPAEKEDCKAIHKLLLDFAIEEDDEEGYTNTCEDLMSDGFDKNPWFHSVVAEKTTRKKSGDHKKEVVGFIIYSFVYDSWRGRAVNISGEYIRKDQRSKQLGSALADAVSLHAADQGCKEAQFITAHRDVQLRKMYDKMGAVDHSTGVPDFKRLNYYTITGDNLKAYFKLSEENMNKSDIFVKVK